ncbi:MAG: SUMF1/EgtB/PvdO family nonheme iron enzyme, partial [Pyrinomonadaceae bacterium]
NGYKRREFWSDAGWAWLQKKAEDARKGESSKIEAPYYWIRRGDKWYERRMFDEVPLELGHPVCGLSWYEADAYARFMGKRLPTEAEWEKAAAPDTEKNQKRLYAWGDKEPSVELANFGRNLWSTTSVGSFPAGAALCGAFDLTGNVWEWTSDEFRGLQGFKSFPYPEYSEIWFDGDHRVLKGGSWATSASILRNTFRNFFRRHFRAGFTGIRCASDG